MSARTWLWSRLCSWARARITNPRHEDWYRRQLEADLNDRECVEEGRAS